MTVPHHAVQGAYLRERPSLRRGAALVAILIVLVLLSFLSLSVARISRGDFRRARDARLSVAAREGADLAALVVQRDWALGAGETTSVGGLLPTVTWSSTLARAAALTMRTSSTTFWTVADGWAGDSLGESLARTSVNIAWRLAVPDVDPLAALTVRDSVTLAGGALVSGTDTTLSAWGATCPAAAPSPAIALPDTTRLCDGACGAGSVGGRALGSPALFADPSAAATTRYHAFGAEDWSTLTAHAAVVLPAGSVVTPAPAMAGASCNRILPTNWGDPTTSAGSCSSWTPIIWAQGDVEILGGVGQGILLADGDVTLSGGALFAGVIVARDDVVSAGTGGTVLGAVLAGDARPGAGDHTTLAGASRVQRSSCAVERALLRSARLQRVRDRAWARLR